MEKIQMMESRGVTRRSFVRAAGAAVGSAAPLIGDDAMAATTLNFARVLSTTLSVNGRSMSISHEARVSLLDLLRERLQTTGTKKGCNEGACGACTVLVNGERVNACMTLAASCEGAEITTVEGLAGPDGAASRRSTGLHRPGCVSMRVLHARPDRLRLWPASGKATPAPPPKSPSG